MSEKKHQVALRLSKKYFDSLAKIAKNNRRSLANQAELFIVEELDKLGVDPESYTYFELDDAAQARAFKAWKLWPRDVGEGDALDDFISECEDMDFRFYKDGRHF